MTITSVTNDEELNIALKRVEEIFGAQDGPELEELNALVDIVHAYEAVRFPMEKPKPHEMLQFQMDRLNLSASDMGQYLGSPSEVESIISGESPLTDAMIQKLHQHLKIPVETFMDLKD
jgi:HTH-type transcriptional regulator/antitoxin HigA